MSERIVLAGFLALSILGHLAVFALIGFQQPQTQPAPQTVLQVALVERPEQRNEPKPDDAETPPESESLAQPPAPELTEIPPREIGPLIASSEAEAKIDPEPAAGARLITNLNTQLPGVVAKLNPMAAPEQKISHLGKAAPKLPGGPSLFDEWMGPVKPNLDRWRDASGGVNAQLTLANGDLVCIKVRAPTTRELFNPWMSAAIPMSRLCGRKNAEPVDLENPWLRARPK